MKMYNLSLSGFEHFMFNLSQVCKNVYIVTEAKLKSSFDQCSKFTRLKKKVLLL